MNYTRRDIAKLGFAAGAASSLIAKPDSMFGGVQIGAITYSFRALPSSAEETLKYLTDCGIGAIELMSNVPESYAGAPAQQGRPGGPPPAGGRPRMTPEQQAAMRKPAEALKAWRLSVSMDKYKAFRKMYADAGINIYAFKLPPTMAMSDEIRLHLERGRGAGGESRDDGIAHR